MFPDSFDMPTNLLFKKLLSKNYDHWHIYKAHPCHILNTFFAEVIEVDFSVDFGQIMHIFLHNQAI